MTEFEGTYSPCGRERAFLVAFHGQFAPAPGRLFRMQRCLFPSVLRTKLELARRLHIQQRRADMQTRITRAIQELSGRTEKMTEEYSIGILDAAGSPRRELQLKVNKT